MWLLRCIFLLHYVSYLITLSCVFDYRYVTLHIWLRCIAYLITWCCIVHKMWYRLKQRRRNWSSSTRRSWRWKRIWGRRQSSTRWCFSEHLNSWMDWLAKERDGWSQSRLALYYYRLLGSVLMNKLVPLCYRLLSGTLEIPILRLLFNYWFLGGVCYLRNSK